MGYLDVLAYADAYQIQLYLLKSSCANLTAVYLDYLRREP